ncbi:hypothetical protein [Streptomyces sp. NPDC002287]
MKPNPFPIMRAAEQAQVGVSDCTLVGGSLIDAHVTHAAGARVITYADNPHKAALFAESGADAIADAMSAIAGAFTTASP